MLFSYALCLIFLSMGKSVLQSKWIIFLSKLPVWIIFVTCMKVGHLGFEPFSFNHAFKGGKEYPLLYPEQVRTWQMLTIVMKRICTSVRARNKVKVLSDMRSFSQKKACSRTFGRKMDNVRGISAMSSNSYGNLCLSRLAFT